EGDPTHGPALLRRQRVRRLPDLLERGLELRGVKQRQRMDHRSLPGLVDRVAGELLGRIVVFEQPFPGEILSKEIVDEHMTGPRLPSAAQQPGTLDAELMLGTVWNGRQVDRRETLSRHSSSQGRQEFA